VTDKNENGIEVEKFMRKISKPAAGLIATGAGALAVIAALQFGLFAGESGSLPHFDIQKAPVSRDGKAAGSYAPVIKHAAPSVVNIYSTRTVRFRRMPMSPFFNPFGDQFGNGGGEMDPNPARPNRRGRQSPGGQTQTRTEMSLGSGVVVSADGYVLTANHVVRDADPNGVKVALVSGGKEFTAKIVGTDPATDVAVLKIDAKDLQAITIGDSDQLDVGDVVLAIGNPFGVGQTVTMGIVSGKGRTSLGIIPEGYENFIQTDAAINMGNSGGALVDAEGRLVGINTAIFSSTGGSVGVGFAVPANLARDVMERLIKYGKVTRGYLGVTLQPEITPGIAEMFQLPDSSGAMVSGISSNTPAARAGLQRGDVVREVDGKKIADRDQLRLLISQTPPGTKVNLKFLHGDAGKKPVEKTATVTLGTLPEELAMRPRRTEPTQPQTSTTPDGLDGVEVDNLSQNIRRQLNIPGDVQGALVSNVEENSNAASASPTGLEQGDVIMEIDRQPVHNAEEAIKLTDKSKGKLIMLLIWRDRGSLYITVDNTKTK
jgi:serine protease Do